MNAIAECTVPEKILLAAHGLEDQGQSPFSAEALIVAAWQKYPHTFGLKGYDEHYPDSNKVLASIMGEKGLTRRGWLIKMGQKLYSLTRDGRQVVRRLTRADEPATTTEHPPVKLSREHDKLLQQLLISTAHEKYVEGRHQELTFADACRFWSITENQMGEILDARLDHLSASLAEIERQVGVGSTVLSNGRVVSSEEIGVLCDVHQGLQKRFGRHLTLLRTRGGKP